MSCDALGSHIDYPPNLVLARSGPRPQRLLGVVTPCSGDLAGRLVLGLASKHAPIAGSAWRSMGLQNFQILQPLGKGAFASVFKVSRHRYNPP
jgi:hypothetical protein